MNDYVKAWQCIGCGKIEAPQTCVGVCQDRKVQFVYAEDHEQTVAELAVARLRVNALETLVRRLACTSPHKDRWEYSYKVMQGQARALLASTWIGPRAFAEQSIGRADRIGCESPRLGAIEPAANEA